MRIDAHQHFWRYDPNIYSWITEEMSVLRRDFLPLDLLPVLQGNQIDGCVAVQADQNDQETEFLLELAGQHEFIKAVVGWVDLRGDQLEAQLEYLSQFENLKGFRHIVQGEADHNFLLRPKFIRGIRLLKKYEFTYDILVFPHQLGAVLEFVKQFPEQAFVIDHIAKPYIKDGFLEGWATLIKAIAQYPNVSVKISGMVTEANWKSWQYNDFVPYLDVIFEAFTPNRILFGSDWPVCLVAANYERMKNIIDRYIGLYSPNDQEKIMGGNALRFYGID